MKIGPIGPMSKRPKFEKKFGEQFDFWSAISQKSHQMQFKVLSLRFCLGIGFAFKKPMHKPGDLIVPHGGYQKLKSYQASEIVYDATVVFCNRFINLRSRTHDQMVQAARSGKQNIAEGCMASGTSKKFELKLIGVARASLEELLLDYCDFLRQRGLGRWGKDHTKSQKVRRLAFQENRSYGTYRTYVESSPEVAANTLICLIHQTNYLLDQQLRQLERQFLKEGGFTERLFKARYQVRKT